MSFAAVQTFGRYSVRRRVAQTSLGKTPVLYAVQACLGDSLDYSDTGFDLARANSLRKGCV